MGENTPREKRYSLSDYDIGENGSSYDEMVASVMNDLGNIMGLDSSDANKRASFINTLREIQKISVKRYTFQSKMGSAGACALIFLLTKDFLSDPEVTTSILKTIDVLITNENNNKCIFAESGAIKYFAEVAKRYAEDTSVLKTCFKAILNMTNSKVRASIQGGLTPKKLQASSSMSGNYIDTKLLIGNEGICELAMSILKFCNDQVQSSKDLVTYKETIMAINNVVASLAACTENLIKFGKTDVVNILLTTMELYKDEHLEAQNLDMWISWLWAVINVCVDPRYLDKKKFGLYACQFIYAELKLFSENLDGNIASYPDPSKYIEYKLWALHNILSKCDENLAEVIRVISDRKTLVQQFVDAPNLSTNARAKGSSLLALIRDGEKRGVLHVYGKFQDGEEEHGEEEKGYAETEAETEKRSRGGPVVVKGGKIIDDGTGTDTGLVDFFVTEQEQEEEEDNHPIEI